MKRIFLSLIFLYLLSPLPGYAVAPPMQLLQQLKDSNYAALDEFISTQQRAYEAGTNNELVILQTLNPFQSSNEGLEEQLDKWVADNPDAYPAYLARGSYYTHIAGLHRGAKSSDDTHAQQFANMRRYHDRAREDFNIALSINNKLMYAYGMLIRIAASSGTWEDVYRLADASLEIDPASYLVHRYIMFKFQPKWGGSMKAINKWLKLKIKPHAKKNPLLKALFGYPDYIRAERLCSKKKYKQAEYYFDKSVAASDGGYNVLFLQERGSNFFSRDAYERALKDLNKVLFQYPYYIDALQVRGRTLYDMKRYDEALQDMNLAISLDQYNPKLRRARSYLFKDLKMYKQGVEDINAALKYGSFDSRNWRAKGYLLLYNFNDFRGAETAFTKAVELDPKNESSWYELGIAQYKQLSCDFMTPMQVYLDLCKSTNCGKQYVEWSTSSLRMAVDKGYCEKPTGSNGNSIEWSR